MNKVYRIWVFGLFFVLVGFGLWWGIASNSQIFKSSSQIFSPEGDVKKDLPYDKYSFERLVERGGVASRIEILGNKFYYNSEGRRISGEINLPTGSDPEGGWPVIVMARGYVDKEIYKSGIGTHNSALVYAKAGYITLAPDFSGYGESDPEMDNSLGARLTKPVEILDLLSSLQALPQADLSRVYLWGHSNGGQIMLSVSEILGMQVQANKNVEYRVRGVTLWAPVSKPFPYNILYYTDEADDQGKWLRSQISEFEKDYDVFKYSIDHYLDKIAIPIQLHQGSADESVPKKWSDDLVKTMKENGKEITYYVYPGADHNMKPQWDSVVSRDLQFFADLQK